MKIRNVKLTIKLRTFSLSPEEDSEGSLGFKSEVKVFIWAQARSKRTWKVISDAYSMRSKIDFETQLFKTNKVACQDKSQVILKEIVKINGRSPVF